MATGVNIKMGVSGISQFKQNMKTAQTSVKTLDQALALNEKQFKATGDAEDYMKQKSELLQRKIEEQRTIVAQAEQALKQMSDNGVDKTSAAFQTMQQQLLRAKGDLLDTENQMNGVAEAGEAAGDGVDAMNTQLNRIGEQMNLETVKEGIESITSKMEAAASTAWKMGEAIVKNTLGAGAWADELATTAAQYQITPEELQRMRKTAQIIDTDADTIISARDKMVKNTQKAGQETMGAWAALGIDPSMLATTEDKFWAAGEALMAMTDKEDQQTYAMAIFGKSWRELIPLFSAGREEYEKTMDSWSVVSDEQLNSLTAMDDQYQKLQGEWETFKMEILSVFAGPMTEGMETLTGLVKEFNEYLSTPEGKEMLDSMSTAISGMFKDLSSIDPQQVIQGFTGVFDKITEGFKWIDENKNGLVQALETIVLGWGALKLTGGALQVFQLINGIKGLTASAATSAGTSVGTAWGAAFGAALLKASPVVAFLYTLLKPAGTAKVVLDSLWDENGNPTTAGRAAGITWTREENAQHEEKQKSVNLLSKEERQARIQQKQEEQRAKLEEMFETGQAYHKDRSPGAMKNQLPGRDYTPEDTGTSRMFLNAMDRMNKAVEESSVATHTMSKNSLTPADLNHLTGLPGEIASAVERARIAVYIDGQQAGASLAPYVGGALGGQVRMMTK